MFAQLLVNGLIAGAIYALVASGFSLIFRTTKFIHFAHGSVVAVGAYLLFLFFNTLHINFWLAAILTVISSGVFGWIMNKVVYEALRKRKASNVILLIASVGLLILIESLILLFFGADVKSINFLKITEGYHVLGAIITPLQIAIIITSAVLLLGLSWLMKKTKLGRAMRAVADNKDVAEIVGISAKRIYAYAFFIGSAIAGVAGILVGMEQNLAPTMGVNLMVKGFAGAIIGSVSSVPGAVVGSLVLGIVENFGIWFLPSGYKDAIAFVILFIFLIVKPEGLFAKKTNRA